MAKAKLFKKKLVPCGRHIAPQGEVVVTPQRVKRWINKFEQLSKEGVRFPEPWGHILDAIPADDHETRKFAKARWNAGYIHKLEQDPNDGGLVMLGTVPPGWEVEDGTGDLINQRDGTRIGEVSVGIGNWKDGKGRVHDDIVIHAALVPLPVWANQDSFQALSTSSPDASVTFTSTLSTTTSGGRKMAKPQNDEQDDIFADTDNDAETPDDHLEPDADNDLADDLEPMEGDLPPIEPDMAPPPAPVPEPVLPEQPMSMDGDKVRSLVGIFNQMGANLPPDTNPSNFLDRVMTQFMVFQKLGVTLTPKMGGDDAQATTTIDTGVGDATPENPAQAGGMMMMSTNGRVVKLDSRSYKLASASGDLLRKKLQQDWQNLGAGKNERFRRFCDSEAKKIATFTLSLNEETGAVTIPDAIARLQHTKSVLDSLGHADLTSQLTQTLSTAIPDANSPAKRDESYDKRLDELAARVYGDPNAKAAKPK